MTGKNDRTLLAAVKKFSDCTTANYSDNDLSYRMGENFDAVVISGSAARIVNPFHRAKFEGVVELIKTCNLPIFGVCFGHQLLCLAFGAQVGALSERVYGCFEEVRVIEPNNIFEGFKAEQTVPLAEYHNDYVIKETLSKAGFILLADSASCEVEAVKHKSNPFYGVQFHPEQVKIKGVVHPEGHRIIGNFYTEVVKR